MYRYYVCLNASKTGYESCSVTSVSAGEIEEAILGQLKAILRSPEMIAQTCIAAKQLQVEEKDRLRDEKALLESRIAELQERLRHKF
jgi:hypothetical protein